MFRKGFILIQTPIISQTQYRPEQLESCCIETDLQVTLDEVSRISEEVILLPYTCASDIKRLHNHWLTQADIVIYGAGSGFRQDAGAVLKTVMLDYGHRLRFRGYLRYSQAIAAAESGYKLKLNRNGDYSTKMRFHPMRQRIVIDNEVPYSQLKYGWVIEKDSEDLDSDLIGRSLLKEAPSQ